MISRKKVSCLPCPSTSAPSSIKPGSDKTNKPFMPQMLSQLNYQEALKV